MAKKRSLVDAAKDPVYGKKRARPIQPAPSQRKPARNRVLASISIAVGFIGGVVVDRYLRLF